MPREARVGWEPRSPRVSMGHHSAKPTCIFEAGTFPLQTLPGCERSDILTLYFSINKVYCPFLANPSAIKKKKKEEEEEEEEDKGS